MSKKEDVKIQILPVKYLEGYAFTPFMDEFKKIDADGWFRQQKIRQLRSNLNK